MSDFIPVARISDMLLNPGETIEYNGQTLTYPSIKLVYWAGGNPFHHHQESQPPTAMRGHSLKLSLSTKRFGPQPQDMQTSFSPCTTPLERNDLGISTMDCYLTPMLKAVEPFAESRK